MWGEGASPTQLTLVFINLLLVASGIMGITVGGWVLIYREEAKALTLIDVATNDFGLLQNAAILLITSGLAIFSLGFVGCCAAFKKITCLRVLSIADAKTEVFPMYINRNYICMVALCCFVTIAACSVAFVFRDQMEEKLLDHLQQKLQTEYQGFSRSTFDFSMALDYAQVEFECCGIRDYKDFKNARNWTVKASAIVPPTCCILKDRKAYLNERFFTLYDSDCVQFPNATNSNIFRPCYQELKNWMAEEATIMGGVAIATIVLELLAIIFIAALMYHTPKEEDNLYRPTAEPWRE